MPLAKVEGSLHLGAQCEGAKKIESELLVLLRPRFGQLASTEAVVVMTVNVTLPCETEVFCTAGARITAYALNDRVRYSIVRRPAAADMCERKHPPFSRFNNYNNIAKYGTSHELGVK